MWLSSIFVKILSHGILIKSVLSQNNQENGFFVKVITVFNNSHAAIFVLVCQTPSGFRLESQLVIGDLGWSALMSTLVISTSGTVHRAEQVFKKHRSKDTKAHRGLTNTRKFENHPEICSWDVDHNSLQLFLSTNSDVAVGILIIF